MVRRNVIQYLLRSLIDLQENVRRPNSQFSFRRRFTKQKLKVEFLVQGTQNTPSLFLVKLAFDLISAQEAVC